MTVDDTLPRVGAELQWEVSQFLYHEAALLDGQDYAGWLNLLTADMRYRMPVRVTRERKDGSDIDQDTAYLEEDLAALTVRVARFETNSAWAEDPPSRTRHFVTNVIVDAREAPGEVAVRSNLLFTRSRGSRAVNDQLSGARDDILRRVNGAWKLARRNIVFDQAVLGTLNLSTIY